MRRSIRSLSAAAAVCLVLAACGARDNAVNVAFALAVASGRD